MGLANSPDIFQEKMSTLMADLEFARTYLDDLLALTKSTFEDHLMKLELMLERLQNAGLKVNADKSTFCATEIKYLGYIITRKGIKPVKKKIDAILKIQAPQNVRQLRRFLGMVQYYRDLWQHRSHILTPLTDLVGECGTTKGKKRKGIKKWYWTEQHQKAFIDIKAVLSREVLLAYPNFSLPFELHTDASSRQLGAVISQEGHPLAFFSRKLSKPQQNYTVTELELLSIVETLKEFRNILLGYKIIVHTDHKNLEHDSQNMESQRALRWRLLIEEFNPTFKYIKGENNIVADALSRLEIEQESNSSNIKQLLAMNNTDEESFPINSHQMSEAQLKDPTLKKRMERNPKKYTKRFVHGGELILEEGKIYIPTKIRPRVVNWYHHFLCHPGTTRLDKTLRETMTWPGLKEMVKDYCKRCKECQLAKRLRRKYGKVPPKIAEDTPWKVVCVDFVGPYTVKQKNNLDANGKPIEVTLSCLTMIDPATSWFEWAIIPPEDCSSAHMSQLFNNHWLSRYPRPVKIIYDNGSEFKLNFKQLCKDFQIKQKPTTVKNPRANAIIERIHGVLGNAIRAYNLGEMELDPIDPWGSIMANIAWAVRSTYHTTIQATPGQLVYGRDMLFDIEYIANWKSIQARKQASIDKNTFQENYRRTDWDYQIGDLVTIKWDEYDIIRKVQYVNEGPYKVTNVYTNGTVRIQRGTVNERLNIRRINPFFS